MPKGSVNVPKGFMEEGTFYYDMGGQRRPILKGTVDKYAVVGPSSSGNSQAVVKVDPTPEVEIDTRDLNQIAIDNAGVPYYDDTAPVSPFGDGYHQREGTNAWTVNNNDDFWMTEEGGKKAETIWGSRPGFVKQKPVQEFQMPDFSSWFQGDK